MAISAFVPEVWSAELLVELEKSLVYGAAGVVNRDYEGDISQFGDTVHVTTLADPTVDDYVPHTDIDIDEVDDSSQTLVIDQAKYFAFEVDDIEQRQARSGGAILTEQARKAAYVLRDTADQFLAGLMATDVDAGNELGEQTLTEVEEAYGYLVDLSVLLDEANVPTEGRWVIVTPAYHGLLLRDDRFIAAGDEAGSGVRANGMVGNAAGFSVRKSNNAPGGSTTGSIQIAGYGGATSYAEQINKTEAARRELGFSDIVKGLHLYGGEVFRPTGLATLDAIIDIGGGS